MVRTEAVRSGDSLSLYYQHPKIDARAAHRCVLFAYRSRFGSTAAIG